MASKSQIFLDLSTEELVEDLARFIATLKKEGSESPFVTEILTLLENNKLAQIGEKFVAQKDLLLQIPSNDLEGTYNLLVSFLVQNKQANLLPTLLEPLLAAQLPGKASYYFNVLINSFTQLESKNPVCYDLYLLIVKFAEKHHRVHYFISNIQDLEDWMTTWGVSADKQRELYLMLRDMMLAHNQPARASELLIKYLRTFESASLPELQVTKPHAIKAIAEAIGIPSNFQMDHISGLKAVAALKEEAAFKLLGFFSKGQLKEYVEFYNSHKGAVDSMGLSHEKNMTKLRLISLATLAAQNPDLPISFDTICSALDISESEVEVWVIDAIRFKLIEAKIDEINREVRVTRATYRVFGDHQWKTLKSKLHEWTANVNEILQVVQTAKLVAAQNAH